MAKKKMKPKEKIEKTKGDPISIAQAKKAQVESHPAGAQSLKTVKVGNYKGEK